MENRHKWLQTFANGRNLQFIFSHQTYSPKFPVASATGSSSLYIAGPLRDQNQPDD